jgi:hypothetical protein
VPFQGTNYRYIDELREIDRLNGIIWNDEPLIDDLMTKEEVIDILKLKERG